MGIDGRPAENITYRLLGAEPVTIDANSGENLLDVARKANVAIDAPCSGNGACGKCRACGKRLQESAARTGHGNLLLG